MKYEILFYQADSQVKSEIKEDLAGARVSAAIFFGHRRNIKRYPYLVPGEGSAQGLVEEWESGNEKALIYRNA